MVEITSALGAADPRFMEGMASGLAPSSQWGVRPRLTSSDVVAARSREQLSADARDAARANPYGRSATRSTGDAVIGASFKLQLEPNARVLGVDEDAATEWAEEVEAMFDADASSVDFVLDAQRKQPFNALMRTAWDSYYRDGETAGVIKWKAARPDETRTKLLLIDAERISDPNGMIDPLTNRRMGVERDPDGEPVAYHIRNGHPSDEGLWKVGAQTWARVPRYGPTGRPLVIHAFEHDRPDMTRGMSTFTSALLPMRLLQDYQLTELETAAVRATYAAVIESELDYDEAMKVIGDSRATAVNGNPVLDFTLRMMSERASYYRGQDFRFGKSKVAHLLPNEKLHMVQGNNHSSALKDFSEQNLYTLASALGVDYATLTKNYSDTNYSGARAALFDVWRSYEVRRSVFIAQVPMLFVSAWLEEKVVVTRKIPMLGDKSFYAARSAICAGTFETWSKPRLDPLKENQADKVLYDMGAVSLKDLCAIDGRDYRRVLMQRAREKGLMNDLGLKPEDINPEINMNKGKQAHAEGAGSEGRIVVRH